MFPALSLGSSAPGPSLRAACLSGRTWQGWECPAVLVTRPLAWFSALPAPKFREVKICFNVLPRLSEFDSHSRFGLHCLPFPVRAESLSLVTVDILGQSSVMSAVLHIVGRFAASLASAH